MGFMTTSRWIPRLLPQSLADDAMFLREKPELIALEPDAGVTPSTRPPVRIFLGTEPGQYRAERIFIWSIEQVRDRTRRYEIYLMKDLAGFDRRLWLTGFTNYRLAIPHLAGGTGRAIYNDVDQVYLADPAELFDTDMHDRGFLALSSRDTAVMLMDCERMKSVWTLEQARHGRRKTVEAKANDVWGKLEPEWHCRDWEYVEGESKCVHFTTIHTQPWQPCPHMFVYQDNAIGHVFFDLERAADEAGFHAFSLAEPSFGFTEVVEKLRSSGAPASVTKSTGGRAHDADVEEIAEAAGARTILRVGVGVREDAAAQRDAGERAGTTITAYDPTASDAGAPQGRFDGVACTDMLEHLVDDDVVWVIHELFRHADRFVHVAVHQKPRAGLLGRLGRIRRSGREPAWWYDRMRLAGELFPEIQWKLDLTIVGRRGRKHHHVREGGRRPGGPPKAWVLLDHKSSHTTQSLRLARALGWPYEVKPVSFNAFNLATDRRLGPDLLGLHGSRAGSLTPPWPDVVISTGWRTVPISRWIAEQSGGRTRTVQMGRKGGDVVQRFDAAVTCSHLRLPPNAHRVETLAPLGRVTPEELDRAARRWPDALGDAPRPAVVLMVGGGSREHRLDAQMASRIGDEVGRFAAEAGGTVFAVTGRRTGAQAEEALEAALGGAGCVERLEAGRHDNPYLAYIALADAIVVTGDNESMVAEAVASGKPVYIYPLPKRAPSPQARFAQWVTRIAYSRPRKKKGTVRDQQGREYLCSRLIERGIVRPPRDLDAMCESLIREGYARRFGEPLATGTAKALREYDDVAADVSRLLGWTSWDDGQRASRPAV